MIKRMLLPLFFILTLVACGQALDTGSTAANDDSTTTDSVHATVPNGELPELKVHYIDAGQADATLFQFNDNGKDYHILFDAGDWKRHDVIDYLHSAKVPFIDLLIISHPDADHIGQMADIIHTFGVGEVWMSGNESTSKTFQRALEAVLDSGADYHEPRTGEIFSIGPMEINVVHPANITGKANEESLSAKFTYGSVSFLFTGDADKQAELQMIDSGMDLHADILQLGHHGSNTSTDTSFLTAVNPDIAIYSAGLDNDYGHPHQEVVTRVQQAGIKLYGTDVHGTILIQTNGKQYTIETNKKGRINSRINKKSETLSNPTNKQKDNNCIDINTASVEEVQQIIHMGSTRAQELIDKRPFRSINDLTNITGISKTRIGDIKQQGLACVK